jgi:hypothetical protein
VHQLDREFEGVVTVRWGVCSRGRCGCAWQTLLDGHEKAGGHLLARDRQFGSFGEIGRDVPRVADGDAGAGRNEMVPWIKNFVWHRYDAYVGFTPRLPEKNVGGNTLMISQDIIQARSFGMRRSGDRPFVFKKRVGECAWRCNLWIIARCAVRVLISILGAV